MTVPSAAPDRAFPPHSLQAEIAVLGAMLAGYSPLVDLEGHEFVDPVHECIFQTVRSRSVSGLDSSAEGCAADLEEALEQVGGTPYLAQLQANAASLSDLNRQVAVIRDTWEERSGIGQSWRFASVLGAARAKAPPVHMAGLDSDGPSFVSKGDLGRAVAVALIPPELLALAKHHDQQVVAAMKAGDEGLRIAHEFRAYHLRRLATGAGPNAPPGMPV